MNRLTQSILASLGALYASSVIGAFAHDAPSGMKYSIWCCQGDGHNGDCQPISDKTVVPVNGGFQIILNVGDHHLVTKRHVFTVPMKDVKWSTDGQYHACLWPDENTLRCFYSPPQGS